MSYGYSYNDRTVLPGTPFMSHSRLRELDSYRVGACKPNLDMTDFKREMARAKAERNDPQLIRYARQAEAARALALQREEEALQVQARAAYPDSEGMNGTLATPSPGRGSLHQSPLRDPRVTMPDRDTPFKWQVIVGLILVGALAGQTLCLPQADLAACRHVPSCWSRS